MNHLQQNQQHSRSIAEFGKAGKLAGGLAQGPDTLPSSKEETKTGIAESSIDTQSLHTKSPSLHNKQDEAWIGKPMPHANNEQFPAAVQRSSKPGFNSYSTDSKQDPQGLRPSNDEVCSTEQLAREFQSLDPRWKSESSALNCNACMDVYSQVSTHFHAQVSSPPVSSELSSKSSALKRDSHTSKEKRPPVPKGQSYRSHTKASVSKVSTKAPPTVWRNSSTPQPQRRASISSNKPKALQSRATLSPKTNHVAARGSYSTPKPILRSKQSKPSCNAQKAISIADSVSVLEYPLSSAEKNMKRKALPTRGLVFYTQHVELREEKAYETWEQDYGLRRVSIDEIIDCVKPSRAKQTKVVGKVQYRNMIINFVDGEKFFYNPRSDARTYFCRTNYAFMREAEFHMINTASNRKLHVIPVTAAGLLFVFDLYLNTCYEVGQNPTSLNYSDVQYNFISRMSGFHCPIEAAVAALKSCPVLNKMARQTFDKGVKMKDEAAQRKFDGGSRRRLWPRIQNLVT